MFSKLFTYLFSFSRVCCIFLVFSFSFYLMITITLLYLLVTHHFIIIHLFDHRYPSSTHHHPLYAHRHQTSISSHRSSIHHRSSILHHSYFYHSLSSPPC